MVRREQSLRGLFLLTPQGTLSRWPRPVKIKALNVIFNLARDVDKACIWRLIVWLKLRNVLFFISFFEHITEKYF